MKMIEFNIEISGKLNLDDYTTSEMRLIKWHDLNITFNVEKTIENFKKVLRKYNEVEMITLSIVKDDKEIMDGIRYNFKFDEVRKRKLDESKKWYSIDIERWNVPQKNKSKIMKDIEKEIIKFINLLQEEYIKFLQQSQQAVV